MSATTDLRFVEPNENRAVYPYHLLAVKGTIMSRATGGTVTSYETKFHFDCGVLLDKLSPWPTPRRAKGWLLIASCSLLIHETLMLAL
jgi:hypothetical protein